jgi:hypothetical protein
MQQATHPRPALEIGYSIADRLTLLHPSRWTAVELTIGRHAEAPIVSAAHVTTDAGPPAATWCDRKAELGLLNRDLAALLHAVQADGGAWDAGALVAERRMSGKLVLSGAPGLRIELAQADLAIGAELLAALARAAPELQARQEALDRAIGPARRVSWSFKDATARFDEGDLRPLQVLGSFAPGPQSWCWSWANPTLAEFPASFAEVRSLACPQPGQGVFRLPEMVVDAVFAGHVARLAAHRIDRAVWVVEREEDTLYLALRE